MSFSEITDETNWYDVTGTIFRSPVWRQYSHYICPEDSPGTKIHFDPAALWSYGNPCSFVGRRMTLRVYVGGMIPEVMHIYEEHPRSGSKRLAGRNVSTGQV
ncbi:MAG: hypothetical protein LBB18_02625 [Puniceicoccales bacterium]|nr:hypothetical protein [Puniceicoccales bacterium]